MTNKAITNLIGLSHDTIWRLTKKFEEGVKWIGVKQKFFNHTIVAKQGFSYAEVNANVPPDSSGLVTNVMSSLRVNIPSGSSVKLPFSIYYGPNDYQVLKKYGIEAYAGSRLD